MSWERVRPQMRPAQLPDEGSKVGLWGRGHCPLPHFYSRHESLEKPANLCDREHFSQWRKVCFANHMLFAHMHIRILLLIQISRRQVTEMQPKYQRAWKMQNRIRLIVQVDSCLHSSWWVLCSSVNYDRSVCNKRGNCFELDLESST